MAVQETVGQKPSSEAVGFQKGILISGVFWKFKGFSVPRRRRSGSANRRGPQSRQAFGIAESRPQPD